MGEKRKKAKAEKPKAEEAEKEESKSPKSDLAGEDAIVFDYMLRQNRPYSSLNVFDNLRGAVKKPNCIKVLDKLSEMGKLQAKDFGKARVYLVSQNLLPEVNEDELAQIDREIAERTEELDKLKDEVKEIQLQIKELDEELSNEEIDDQLAVLTVDTEELLKEVEGYKSAGCVTEQESKVLEERMKIIVNEEKKRRIMFNNLIRSIADVVDISVKELKEKIEFEEP